MLKQQPTTREDVPVTATDYDSALPPLQVTGDPIEEPGAVVANEDQNEEGGSGDS